MTGLLVPYTAAPDGSRAPADRDAFVNGIAERVNALLDDPQRASEMGRAGRERVMSTFAWPAIAEQTVALYERARVLPRTSES